MLTMIGFALFEAGCINQKNLKNLLVRTAINVVVGTVVFWACGWTVAFGGLSGFNKFLYGKWMFYCCYSCMSLSVFGSCVSTRCSPLAYTVLAVLFAAVTQPVVIRFTTSEHTLFPEYFDGSVGALLAVNVSGGAAGLVCEYLLGPRNDTFRSLKARQLVASEVILSILGLMMVFMSWLGTVSLAIWIPSFRGFGDIDRPGLFHEDVGQSLGWSLNPIPLVLLEIFLHSASTRVLMVRSLSFLPSLESFLPSLKSFRPSVRPSLKYFFPYPLSLA